MQVQMQMQMQVQMQLHTIFPDTPDTPDTPFFTTDWTDGLTPHQW